MTASAVARGPDAAESKQEHRQAGKNRDVAAGNRDDVIRACLLQPALHLGVQPCAIANQDCGHDCRRSRAPRRHARRDRTANRGTCRRTRLREPCAAAGDINEPVALDRAHQRDTAPRQLPLRIADARVEILGRRPKGGGKCDAAAAAPLQNPIALWLAANADEDAAAGGMYESVQLDAIDEHVERHARWPTQRVSAQASFDCGEQLMLLRRDASIKISPQFLMARRRICIAPERRSRDEESD